MAQLKRVVGALIVHAVVYKFSVIARIRNLFLESTNGGKLLRGQKESACGSYSRIC